VLTITSIPESFLPVNISYSRHHPQRINIDPSPTQYCPPSCTPFPDQKPMNSPITPIFPLHTMISTLFPPAFPHTLLSFSLRASPLYKHQKIKHEPRPVFSLFPYFTLAGTSSDKGIEVKSSSGRRYELNFAKPGSSVLHPKIKVISLGADKETGFQSYHQWEPSNDELRDAEEVYVDEKSQATVRFQHKDGKRSLTGVVNGVKLEYENGEAKLYDQQLQNRSDYIDIGRKLTPSKLRESGPFNAVVEILVVIDKELGDVFQQDRKKILDYLTVYFWDVNLRFSTLTSNNISVRITGVVVMESPDAQPFIEEARAADGRAEFGRILGLFKNWIYNQMGSLPKFDIAVVMTSTNLEWGGGLAYGGGACGVDDNRGINWGVTVFNDGGDFGSLTTGTHEMAHTIGAPHDDPTLPGGCDYYNGYIMSGGGDELRWYFSPCSDRFVDQFLRTDGASCLRRIDETGSLPIPADFIGDDVAPGMDEQCKRRLKNPNAFVQQYTYEDCKRLVCWDPQPDSLVGSGFGILQRVWILHHAAGTDSSDSFLQGTLFKNVGNALCLGSSEWSGFSSPVVLKECPSNSLRGGTALDRFAITSTQIGTTLETPYALPGIENGTKCIIPQPPAGTISPTPTSVDLLSTSRCDSHDPMQGWDFIRVANREFMLSHRVTGKCAIQSDQHVFVLPNCDKNDPAQRWTYDTAMIYLPPSGSMA
ncbi:Venom metalloproteinase 3, partial [Orchesella cincta]